MCDTNAYIVRDGKEEMFLESVDLMRPENGTIYLTNLFGEQKTFEGRIREISFLKRKVVLEKR